MTVLQFPPDVPIILTLDGKRVEEEESERHYVFSTCTLRRHGCFNCRKDPFISLLFPLTTSFFVFTGVLCLLSLS